MVKEWILARLSRRSSAQCKRVPQLDDMLRVLAALGLMGALTSCTSTSELQSYEPCSQEVAGTNWRPPTVFKDGEPLSFEAALAGLGKARAVLLGEYHARFDHHLTQLEVICRLHAADPALAIGVEFVQTPFQAALDRYVAGESETRDLLRETQYFSRWGYDFRLYEPIVEFARRHAIPVVALNAPAELTTQVGHTGLAALDATTRAQLPDRIDAASDAYRQRMRDVFEAHANATEERFESFVEVQLLWDESMAQSGGHYLTANPDHRLIVIAGNGHTGFVDAIPARLARQISGQVVSVAQVIEDEAYDASYRFRSDEVSLQKSGLMGVMLKSGDNGVSVDGFSEDSAAQGSGVAVNDKLTAIDGAAITSYEDVKLALWRKLAGDAVTLRIERAGQTRTLEITLR